MNIKQASELTGISRDMIRFYEKKGMIRPERKDNGYRDYTYPEVLRLLTINQYSAMGIRLDTIGDLMDNRDVTMFRDELDEAVKRLEEETDFLKQRLYIATQLQQMFVMLEEGKPYQISSVGPFYYYQRENVDEYASLSGYRCAQVVLRIREQEAQKDVMSEYDQGKLFVYPVDERIHHEYYPKQLMYQTTRMMPQNVDIADYPIRDILQEMNEHGYVIDGDLFMFELMGNSRNEDDEDVVAFFVPCRKVRE
ncbi:MAG: MerR family transcriptional regulator [Erysipelotrichaceae bacterium]|nr:MerR family transcriptional regulator [Erysipelotrichaceae bacterium]